jgi:hypothetical protein
MMMIKKRKLNLKRKVSLRYLFLTAGGLERCHTKLKQNSDLLFSVITSSHTFAKPLVKSQVFFCFFGTKNFRGQMSNICKKHISDTEIKTYRSPAKRKLALNVRGFVQLGI